MFVSFILNTIWNVLGTIIFYKFINKIWRTDELKKYRERTIPKGTYDKKYENEYSNHLKGKCVLLTITFFVVITSNLFFGTIISLVIGTTTGLILGPILGKYYPAEPKEII